MKRLILTLMLVGCSVAVLVKARQPEGAGRLFSPGDNICTDAVWTNGNADFARLRITWQQYEGVAEGTYLWVTNPGGCSGTGCPAPGGTDANHCGNDLDAGIAAAFAAGKHIGISVSAGANSPEWIYDPAGAHVYKFLLDPSDQTVNGDQWMPLIWDTVYQTKFNNFVTALIAHVNTLPGKSAVWYWVMGGVSKQVDMSTWCQNFDKSTQVTDATLTNTTNNGVKYTKVDSATAHFLTTSNTNCSDPLGFNCITGKALLTTNDGSTAKLRGNSVVCYKTGAGNDPNCPADPVDGTVYLNKATLLGTCASPCTNEHVDIDSWLIGQGEFSQLDALAHTHPVGYPGLTVNYAAGMTGSAGSCGGVGTDGAYTQGIKAVVANWFALVPTTTMILTRSPPYATSQGQTDSTNINCDFQNFYGNQYGTMSVARQASCPPHNPFVVWNAQPGGSQAILPSSAPGGIYQGSCGYTSPGTTIDLLYSFVEHSNKFWELYTYDMQQCDPITGDPTTAAVCTFLRRHVREFNPQVEDQARVKLRGR